MRVVALVCLAASAFAFRQRHRAVQNKALTEWSTRTDTTHGPCAAHIPEGLPISFPLLCTGEASSLMIAASARGFFMRKLYLEVDGVVRGSKTWPIWPGTRSWEVSLGNLSQGVHIVKYSGRLDLNHVILQGTGGSCSFDSAPNFEREQTDYTYNGFNVLNRIWGDTDFSGVKKQQLYFASETLGNNIDGSIDATVVAEGLWKWLYQYSQQQAASDPWGSIATGINQEANIKPWPILDMGYLPRHVGQQITVIEPCNTLSNLAFHEAAVWISCKGYPFTRDEYASLISGFNSMAAGSSFLHSCGCWTGLKMDFFSISWVMMQTYQIMTKQVLADAGSRLSQVEIDAIMFIGHDIGKLTDLAKNMTRLFSQKYDYAVWNATISSIDMPSYEVAISGVVMMALWAMQDKLPVPGLDTALQSLLDALFEQFGGVDRDFMSNIYTPALRKALSFSNLCWSAVMPVTEHLLKFIVTFVEALVFEEKGLPVPPAIRDVVAFLDRMGLTSSLLSDMQVTWDYYSGFNCKNRSDHSIWHEKASHGLVHMLKVAEYFSTDVGPNC